MRLLKKLMITGVVALLLCLAGISAFAAVSITEMAGGVENGSAQCTAAITNIGTDAADPMLILAQYESGILQGVSYSEAASLEAGDSGTLTASLSVAAVTDETRIIAFVLESRKYAIIAEDGILEMERVGSANTNITSMHIEGLDADEVRVDTENKVIDLYVPLYDENGEKRFTEGILSGTITTEDSLTKVVAEDVTFAGTGTEKTGELNIYETDSLSVISEDGTRDDYALHIWRTLEENLDDGVLSGYSTGRNGEKGYYGDFAVKGSLAALIFKPDMNVGTNLNYLEGVGLGLRPVTEALPAKNAAAFPVGDSNAGGNALLLRKNTHESSASGGSGCALLYLNGSAMDGFNQADTCVVEFDIAIGLNVDGPVAQTSVAGLDVYTSGSDNRYRISTTNATSAANARYLAGDTSGHSVQSNLNASQWRHIKLTMTNMGDTFDYTTVIDGQEITDANGLSLGRPTQFMFDGSSLRASELWIDNISIMYH